MRAFLAIAIFYYGSVLIDYLLGLSSYILGFKKKKFDNSHLTEMIIVRLFPTIMANFL